MKHHFFRKIVLVVLVNVIFFLTGSITGVLAAPTDKSLIKTSDNPTVYWYQNGKYYPVFASTLNTMQSNSMPGWSLSSITTVSSIFLPRGPNQDFISTASGSNGLLIKLRSNSAVYEIKDGKREFLTEVVFNQRDYSFNDVVDVPQAILNIFPEVPRADFSFELSSMTFAVAQGQTAEVAVSLKSLNGFNSSVKLSAINLPQGYNPTGTFWNPETLTPSSTNYSISRLYIATNNSTQAGTIPITLKAIGGGLEKVININLTINSAAIPSFSIDPSPVSSTIAQNGSATFTLKITSLNGFNKQVNVAAINLPLGYNLQGTKWSTETVTVPTNGTVQPVLTVATNSSTQTGTFNITLKATTTDGSIAKQYTVSLTINPQTTQCGTAENIRQGIQSVFNVSAPPGDYLPATSVINAILQFRLQQYRELYFSAHDLFGLTQDSLKLASKLLSQGDLESACKHLTQARRFNKLKVDTESASIIVWQTREANVSNVVRSVYDGSKASVVFGVDYVVGPKASTVIEMLYLPLDYVNDKAMYGEDEATRNFKEAVMKDVLVKVLFNYIPLPQLGNKTISKYIEDGVDAQIPASRLYDLLEKASRDPNFHRLLVNALREVVTTASSATIERLATEYEGDLIDILQQSITGSVTSSMSLSSSKSRSFNEQLSSSQSLTITTTSSFAASETSPLASQPRVITTTPTSAAADVAFSLSNISIVFNENIQSSNGGVSIIDDRNNSIPITQKLVSGNTLNLSLGALLSFSSVYKVSIEAGAIRSIDGVSNEPYQWSFTTISPALKIGDEVIVANTGNVGLNLRSSPTESANNIIVRGMPEGTSAIIIGGPTQESGYSWWNMRLKDSGTTGWSAVGNWLSPTDLSGLRIGATVTVSKTSGLGLRLRREPGLQAEQIATLAEGATMNIIGGPYYVDGYLWWNLRGPSATGFSAVSYWLFPSIQSNNLKIADVQPSAIQVKDWNETISYTVTVTDNNGNPVSGAIVSGQNDLQGGLFSSIPQTTNTSGQINYTSTVPNGKANGTYNMIFLASKSGYSDTPQITRQVQVNHTQIPTCNYKLSPTSTNVSSSASSNNSFTVLTNLQCGWTATSNASWITISNNSGSAAGPISFSVEANTGAVRTGIITVAGQPFTITQAAAKSRKRVRFF